MNTQMYAMMCEAEGRYLQRDEVKAIEEYAGGFPKRISAARRIGSQEARIVSDSIEALKTDGDAMGPDGLAVDEWRQVFIAFVRHAAHAHIADDSSEFRDRWSCWAAELIRTRVPADVVQRSFEVLRGHANAHLEPADSAILSALLDIHLAQVRTVTVALR